MIIIEEKDKKLLVYQNDKLIAEEEDVGLLFYLEEKQVRTTINQIVIQAMKVLS